MPTIVPSSFASTALLLMAGCWPADPPRLFGSGERAFSDGSDGLESSFDGAVDVSSGAGGSEVPTKGMAGIGGAGANADAAMSVDTKDASGSDDRVNQAQGDADAAMSLNTNDARSSADVASEALSFDASSERSNDSGKNDSTVGDAGLVRLVQSFPAPGISAMGIAWDGSHVWLSDNSSTLFEMDTEGNLVDSFQSPDATPEGFVWDGTSFWLSTTNLGRIYQFHIVSSGGISMLSRSGDGVFDSPATVVGGGINDDMAWDGQSLWLANQFKVYELSRTGTVLPGTFSFAKDVAGVDWDGSRLWITYSPGIGSGSAFAALDDGKHVIATFGAPVPDVEGIAWGQDDHVWAFGGGTFNGGFVYEIDMSAAKASLP